MKKPLDENSALLLQAVSDEIAAAGEAFNSEMEEVLQRSEEAVRAESEPPADARELYDNGYQVSLKLAEQGLVDEARTVWAITKALREAQIATKAEVLQGRARELDAARNIGSLAQTKLDDVLGRVLDVLRWEVGKRSDANKGRSAPRTNWKQAPYIKETNAICDRLRKSGKAVTSDAVSAELTEFAAKLGDNAPAFPVPATLENWISKWSSKK